MVLILIRHQDDHIDRGHKQDKPLSKCGVKGSVRLGDKLIKRYGRPDLILYSPFLRTRQTAFYSCRQITVKKKCDPALGRYFSKKERNHHSVGEKTSRKAIIDDWDDFKRRCLEWYYRSVNTDAVIWCFTHALVIKVISNHLKIKIRDPIPFGYYLIIKRTNKKLIGWVR